MKKQLKFLLFAVLMLTLVMMTMICVSAAADGDTQATVEEAGGTFNEADYNFKIEDKDGNVLGYYVNLGSAASGTTGGAWSAVPEGGKIVQLQSYSYPELGTAVYLYSNCSFTFDGAGYTITNGVMNFYNDVESGTAANTVKFNNVILKSGSKAAFVTVAHGTTYEFTACNFVSTGSYAFALRATNGTLKFLGDKNVMSGGSRLFSVEKKSTLYIEGGTFGATGSSGYGFHIGAASSSVTIKNGTFSAASMFYTSKNSVTIKIENGSFTAVHEVFRFTATATLTIDNGSFKNTADKILLKFECANTNTNTFDNVCTINGGTFTRSSSGGDKFTNTLIGIYKNTGKVQLNITDGIFNSYTKSNIKFFNDSLCDLNITGGTFNNYHADAAGVIWFANDAAMTSTYKATIGGVENVQTTIDISGANFYQKYDGMPIINLRQTVGCFTDSNPLVMNMKDVTVTGGAAGRFICFINGDSYKVTLDGVKGNFSENNSFVQAQATTNLDLEIINCDIIAKYLLMLDGAGEINVDVSGGTYYFTTGLINRTKTATVEVYIEDGTFSVPTVDALYTASIDMTVDAGTFIVQKIDVDTVFDDVEDFFGGDATMQAGFSIVLDDGATYEFASMDDVVSKFEDLLPTLPDYVTVTGATFELDGGTTLVFTGGEYTTYSSTMFRIIDGTIIATDATFTAPYGRILYITTAAASADMSFTDCTITSGDGFHMFQGSTGSDAIAKFNLTLTNCVCDAGQNITSFGAADDAKVIFNGGTYTAKSIIVYTGSVGEYAFLGGTFTTGGYLFNAVPTNAEENGVYDVTIAGITFTGKNITGISADAATYNVSVKNTNAFLTGDAFLNSKEKSGFLNVMLENVMIVFNVKASCRVVDGLAENVTLDMNGNVIIVTNATTTICGDMVIDANAPAIKYAGELCRAFFSTKTANEFTHGANLYLGADEAQSGIRFVTTLSDGVIALAKAAVDAGKTVAYGTLIAPADYVIAAKAFTKAALDAKFGSVDGVKGEKNIYADVPAKNSLRDSDEDGVYESFSGALVNLKVGNYGRAFAAVAYVVIDGEIFYSSFNTLDQARSAAQMADALIAAGEYADDTAALALLNKYAGK